MEEKLSKTQLDVYKQLKAGDYALYQGYMGWFNPTAYWYMAKTFKRVTAQIKALHNKGLITIKGDVARVKESRP